MLPFLWKPGGLLIKPQGSNHGSDHIWTVLNPVAQQDQTSHGAQQQWTKASMGNRCVDPCKVAWQSGAPDLNIGGEKRQNNLPRLAHDLMGQLIGHLRKACSYNIEKSPVKFPPLANLLKGNLLQLHLLTYDKVELQITGTAWYRNVFFFFSTPHS